MNTPYAQLPFRTFTVTYRVHLLNGAYAERRVEQRARTIYDVQNAIARSEHVRLYQRIERIEWLESEAK